ncbi:hypothetical protein BOTBODRAFT_142458 [Botryobasidium botryosum FD-172 SS1]|uniref:RRM domain-containing protein n=1 Tax=Botryobasidium botryosum (strain FD-172 SS1) TaxID=930990 RepID=A0A067MYF3_BOTB1|nr:hypothetical protein BOTBODRAFT_142458 [Botryobasidium botryosum FD-172 SS1]
MPRPAPPSVRRWGSRYDLIEYAASSAASDRDDDEGTRASTPSDNSTQAGDEEHLGEASDASVALSERVNPPSAGGHANGGDVEKCEKSDGKPSTQRMPHNASIFVASLPSHVPDPQLHSLINAHFGNHGVVRHIKLLHDNKSSDGAMCAFVQMETADQAQEVIRMCHNSHLSGRAIRCELAKAFRTLLVSFVPSRSGNMPQWARMRRRPGSRSVSYRFIQVTFDEEALDPKDVGEGQEQFHNADGDPLNGLGILFSLSGGDTGDDGVIRDIASSLGPLESFERFQVPPFPEMPAQIFAPHPPSRSSETAQSPEALGRDGGKVYGVTWEIKWEHRNDAVSALNALSNFPNLIVTWAHSHSPSAPSNLPFHPARHHNYNPRRPFASRQPNPHSEVGRLTSQSAPYARADNRYPGRDSRSVLARPREPEIVDASHTHLPSHDDFPPLPGAKSISPTLGWIEKGDAHYNAKGGKKPIIDAWKDITNDDWTITDNDTVQPVHNIEDELIDISVPALSPSFTLHTPSTLAPLTPSPVMGRGAGFRNPRFGPVNKRALFVGALSLDDESGWNAERLRTIFEAYGEVTGVQYIIPHSKKPFAFVDFKDEKDAAAAMHSENEKVYDGRPIRVKFRQPSNRGQRHVRKRSTDRGLGLEGLDTPELDAVEASRISTGSGPQDDDTLITLGLIPECKTTAAPEADEALTKKSEDEDDVQRPGSANAGRSASWLSPPRAPRLRAHSESQAQRPKFGDLSINYNSHSSIESPDRHSKAQPGSDSPCQPSVAYQPPTASGPGPAVFGNIMNGVPAHPQFYPSSVLSLIATGALQPYIHYYSYPSLHTSPDGTAHPPFDPYHGQQPPLKPTGFIQADYGMLIPVYHQEALDRYMTSSDKSTRPQGWTEAPPTPAVWQPAVSALPQLQQTVVHDWATVPPPPGPYPMMYRSLTPAPPTFLPPSGPYHHAAPYPNPSFPQHAPPRPIANSNNHHGPKPHPHARGNQNHHTHSNAGHGSDTSRAQNNNGRRFSKPPASVDSGVAAPGHGGPAPYANQPPPYTSEVPRPYRASDGSYQNQSRVFPAQLMAPPMNAWASSSFEGV